MSTAPIELSPAERNLIFQATGRRVASIVTNTTSEKLRTELGSLADKNVLGAFVSLKRHGQLRSCMGCLAESFAMADAIDNAAARAAKDDPRFSPITAAELLELNMEVWILWGMRRSLVPAKERIHEIFIGKHGIVLERGAHRGLLLPGVAVEHQMDALAFLEACCHKANLPANAWLDDSVIFSTFEGLVISGIMSEVQIHNPDTLTAIGRHGPLQMMLTPKNAPGKDDVLKLLDLCRNNFHLCYDGLTPTYMRPDAYDGNVYGIAISIQLPDRPLMVCSKVGTKAEMPLQASLVELVHVLSQQVARIGATHQERIDAKFDLTIFWDPQLHGVLDSFDLSHIDSFRRSIMVASNNGWVLQFNPDVPVTSVLDDAVGYLQVPDRSQAYVLSFETVSTTQHLLASSISKPILGEQKRPPAVAGAFYPSDVTLMNAELRRMFAPGPITASEGFFGTNRPQKAKLHGSNTPPGQDPSGGIRFGAPGSDPLKRARRGPFCDGLAPPELCSAVMVPHAGWIYSGRLAAQTLAKAAFPSTVIIFAPKHRGVGPDWAVAPNQSWLIPGGEVLSDVHLAHEIVRAVDMMQFDANAHEQEHAIEVQLPMISYLAPNTKIVGIVMGSGPRELLQEGAIQFALMLKQLPQMPLLIISTDMNHYASEAATREVDKLALDAVQTLSSQRLLDTVEENRISMCGATATAFVMDVLTHLNMLHECVPVGYTTSAEHSGDSTRVVGYAGMLFR